MHNSNGMHVCVKCQLWCGRVRCEILHLYCRLVEQGLLPALSARCNVLYVYFRVGEQGHLPALSTTVG